MGQSDASASKLSTFGRTDFECYSDDDPVNLIDPSGLIGLIVSYGGTGAVGAGFTSVAGNASVGEGLFYNTQSDTGSMASEFTYGGYAQGSPKLDPCKKGVPFTLGAYGGTGAEIALTNANSVDDVAGPFEMVSFNVGLGPISFGVQYSEGKNAEGKTIGVLGVTPPGPQAPGLGIDLSYYETNTITSAADLSKNPCPCK